VLAFDLEAQAAKAGRRLCVAGNLPYYITSPILLKLAASHAAAGWSKAITVSESGANHWNPAIAAAPVEPSPQV